MEKTIARGLPVQLSHSMVPEVQIPNTRRSCREVRRRTHPGYLRVEELQIEELKVMRDHVHLVVTVPPKVSISELMGFLKGKTAIGIFKHYAHLRRKPYWGNHFWSRGYCVTTIGLDEEKIRRYVKYQEEAERLEEKEREEPGLF